MLKVVQSLCRQSLPDSLSKPKWRCFMKHIFPFLCFCIPLSLNISFSQTNFFQQSSGPYGGWVQSLAVTPDGKIYAGTYLGGLFRSADNGNTWTVTGLNGLTNPDIQDIAINAFGNIFVGTTRGIFKSSDNGVNWISISTGFPNNTGIRKLLTTSQGNIFAATDFGIFKSTDNGSTWNALNNGLQTTNVYAITINSGIMFAGTSRGVYKSTNNGDSWSLTGPSNIQVMTLTVNSNGVVFAGTSGMGYIYRTTNNGDNWNFNNGFPSWSIVYDLVSSSSGELYVATDKGVYKSVDTGLNWNLSSSGMSSFGFIQCLAVLSSSSLIAGSYGNGIFLSTNSGTNWISSNTELSGTLISSLTSDSQNYIYAGTQNGRVYKSTDTGLSWVSTGFDETSTYGLTVNSLAVNSSNVFAGGNEKIYRSTDSGITWSFFTLPNNASPVYSLKINSQNMLFAGTFSKGVFRSTDNGLTWNEVNNGLNNKIFSMAINNSDHVFAGGANGLYRSTDNGNNWIKLVITPNDTIVDAILTTSWNDIFVSARTNFNSTGNSSKIFRSSNNGDSWTQVDAGLNIGTGSFAEDKNKNIFFSTSNSVYQSKDRGNTFTQVSNGLVNQGFEDIISANGYLFIGTFGRGVLRSITPTTSVERLSETVPEKFSLMQNYPNPFNPSTTIEFSIPKTSIVSLKIYNVLGKIVSTLIENESLREGSYKIKWEASKYPSGVYFYRLTAFSENNIIGESRKMILVK